MFTEYDVYISSENTYNPVWDIRKQSGKQGNDKQFVGTTHMMALQLNTLIGGNRGALAREVGLIAAESKTWEDFVTKISDKKDPNGPSTFNVITKKDYDLNDGIIYTDWNTCSGGRNADTGVVLKTDGKSNDTVIMPSTSDDPVDWQEVSGYVKLHLSNSSDGTGGSGFIIGQTTGIDALRVNDYNKVVPVIIVTGNSTNASTDFILLTEYEGVQFYTAWHMLLTKNTNSLSEKYTSYIGQKTVGKSGSSSSWNARTVNGKKWYWCSVTTTVYLNGNTSNPGRAITPYLYDDNGIKNTGNNLAGNVIGYSNNVFGINVFDNHGNVQVSKVQCIDNFISEYMSGEVVTPDVGEEIEGDFCYFETNTYVAFTNYKRQYFDRNFNETEINPVKESIGDVIRLHIGEKPPSDPDDVLPADEESDETGSGEEIDSTGLGVLSTVYSLASLTANAFGKFIWSDGYDPQGKNATPLENVMSFKRFPFTIDGGTSQNIVVGGVDTQITALKHNASVKKFTSGTYTLTNRFKNFFDFEPYTSVSIYLPFIGYRDLSISAIINKEMSLQWIVDISTGSIKCNIVVGGNIINSFDGICAIDLPLTSSNFNELSAAKQQIAGSFAIAAAGSIINSDPVSVVMQGANAALQTGLLRTHFETKGQLDSATALGMAMKPFLLIEYPTFIIPARYGRQVGFMCCRTRRLSELKGFTVAKNVEFNGINAPEHHIEEIRALLAKGVYL